MAASFYQGDQVVVDSPPSFYHGLTGKILELIDYGAVLTFSEAECDRVPDRRRVTPDRPTPFPHGSFVHTGDPIRPRLDPASDDTGSHDACGCELFGPPCGDCGYCMRCNIQIKGEVFDLHAWRHYKNSQEYQDVVAIMRREKTESNPGPIEQMRLQHTIVIPNGPRPETPAAGQVSLWD